MGDFSFRFRIDLAPGSSIASEARVLPLGTAASGRQVELSTTTDDPIAKARRLVLRAAGWRTKEAAAEAGEYFADILTAALVRHRVGADSWGRQGGGMFYAAGLKMLEQQTGQRVLNDAPGLTVYETEPPPRFARLGPMTAIRGVSESAFVQTVQALTASGVRITDRERVAIDLFNASFLEPAADTRLVVLVTAIEALIKVGPRSEAAVALIGSFIETVKKTSLPEPERASLARVLALVRNESIRASGRRLVRERLAGRTYLGRSSEGFWAYCYDLRSRIVHGGNPRAAKGEVGEVAAHLEVFVSDLLTAAFVTVS